MSNLTEFAIGAVIFLAALAVFEGAVGLADAQGYAPSVIDGAANAINSGGNLSIIQAGNERDVLVVTFISPSFNLSSPKLPGRIASAIIAIQSVVAEEAARRGFNVAIPANFQLLNNSNGTRIIYTYRTGNILAETQDSVQRTIEENLK